LLETGAEVAHAIRPGRGAWVQVMQGAVALNDLPLQTGDGAAVNDLNEFNLKAEITTELMVFDL
jgi:redox-sensitive bicupin YhaK (pirin superfamily)